MNHCDAGLASQDTIAATIRGSSSSSLARAPSWSLGVRLEEPAAPSTTTTTTTANEVNKQDGFMSQPAELAHPRLSLEIPTVYLTKKEPHTPSYHVYQLTIKMADGTEWSVYRRYSQFYALHQQLKAKDTKISRLQFPPKRHLNSKASTIVQERRRRLESYMRTLNNYIQDEATILSGLASRIQLRSLAAANDEHLSTSSHEPTICSPMSETNSLSDSACSDQPNADFLLGQTTSGGGWSTSSEQLEKATIRSLFHTFISLREKRDEHFDPASLNGS